MSLVPARSTTRAARPPRRRRHPVTPVLTAVLAAALAAALAVGGPATAGETAPGAGHDRGHGHEHGVPDDQPLPGYTVVNPPLEPAEVGGRPTTVLQGVHQHAAYVVEYPARWNGELVMWAHGYRGADPRLTVDPPAFGLRQHLLERGYAWAASSYAGNDYDVATGVVTTKGLADLASRRLLPHRPRRTYVTGVSMGGHVIGRSLEQYPHAYAGAMPMCGVLGDVELFDYFLGYNVVAQDLADRQVYPPPADYLTDDVPVIQQRLGLVGLTPLGSPTNERGRQLRATTTRLSGGERPGADAAFAVWKDFLFTLYTPDTGGDLAANPGRVAQNTGTTYRPTTPVDVNPTVQRVAADPALRRSHRLSAVPLVDGRPDVPVLTLHGLGDLFVPFSMEQAYARDVARHHRSRLLVQRAIRSAGHCEFSEEEVTGGFDDLTRWVESTSRQHHGHGHRAARGRGHGHHHHVARPAGDRVLDPSVVADPDYGCRFTRGRSWMTPDDESTRGLFAPCPAD